MAQAKRGSSPSKKRTGGSYHRAKVRRADHTKRAASGMVNKAIDGTWWTPNSTSQPGNGCSGGSYRNGWSGALGKLPSPPFAPKVHK